MIRGVKGSLLAAVSLALVGCAASKGETASAGDKPAASAEKPAKFAQIYGSDISPVSVRAALANLDRDGLLPAVSLESGDILERAAPAPEGTMVANPPYGERLSEQEELAAFYPPLGSALKRNFAGWNCYLLTADLRLPKLMRLTPSKKTPLYNGAIECRLFEYQMIAGSARKPKPADKAAD